MDIFEGVFTFCVERPVTNKRLVIDGVPTKD